MLPAGLQPITRWRGELRPAGAKYEEKEMKNKHLHLTLISLLIVVLSVTACTPAAVPPAVPTQDSQSVAKTADALKTEVAGEIISGLTATALANPTETPVPTETEAPTATTEPSPTSAPASITPPPTLAVATLAPTRIYIPPTVTATQGEYQCAVTKMAITPGMVISPGVDFDGRWTVKNTGTKNWAAGAMDYAYVSGDKVHTGDDAYDLNTAVNASKTVDIVVDMEAPKQPGTYKATWAVELDGQVMCYLPLDFRVE